MKFLLVALVFAVFTIGEYRALDIDDYVAYVEELMKDEQFVDEYTKWSYQLFSQPDYLYGPPNGPFPCPIAKDSTVPTSVHQLRPTDIKCVGAMGDSLTAGLGAHAITPFGLFLENRGLSWSVGGDHGFQKTLSIPNALREYYPQLEGFSTKVSVIFLDGQNAKNNHLNVAKSGARSYHMPEQAQLLMSRLKQEELCNWDNDWKMITLFIGGNDLCSFCENLTLHTPEKYMTYVRDTLDALYNASIPRTFVNLVLVLNASNVEELNSGGFVCRTLHKRTCPCAAFPTDEQRQILRDYIPRYQQVLIDLLATGRYDGRDDFTVVYQPFLAKTQLPRKPDHTVDFSYFAPDCFHFSAKGHAQAALSLWNNMLEPVGAKQWAWHMGENLTCPTEEFPYLFTNKNSPAALEKFLQRRLEATTTGRSSSASTISESASSSSTQPSASSTDRHHRHHRHHEKDFQKMHLVVYAFFFLILLMLLILVVCKRQQIRAYAHGAGRRHLNGFTHPQYPDDEEIDVWNRPSGKSSHSTNGDVPKTHGTRIQFE